ncbi:MAG TPA: type II secretion system minor pseudopilin GspK [Geobacteraceae bacterium]
MKKDQRGFALVITLLVTALLVALSAEFVDEVFVDTSARQSFTDGQQASIMAKSGVTACIKGLQTVQGFHPAYTSLADLAQLAKMLNVQDEKGTLQVIVEDESGKLNVNQIFGTNGNVLYQRNYDIAARLFKKFGLSTDLLNALDDWVDDAGVAPHPGGAKSPYYKALKPPYDVKSGKLDTVEELALVKGFSTGTVQQLRPYVTIYTDMPGLININTAPKEIIAALDDRMTDSLTTQMLDYRKTTPFQAAADLAKVAGMETIATGLSTSTTTTGAVFRIVSQAMVGETVRIVEAVVNNGGHVYYWREY